MKIIHVILGKANPNRMNGVNKVVHNLATQQQKDGLHAFIFGITNSENKQEEEKVDRNYNLLLFKRNKYSIDSKLKQEILKFSSSNTIFHIHGGFIIDFYFLSIFLKRHNYKYIFTTHGCYNKEAMKKNFFKKYLFFKIFDKYILRKAWKVQFLGKSEFIHIDNLVKNINKVIIPNGQDLNELEFEYKNLKEKDLIFGFVGRIDKFHKGLDLLIKAYKIYKDQNGKGKLWIIGEGKDLEYLKDYTKKNNLQNFVTFFGSKFGSEKLNLMKNMDVFIHTSRFEGFPMAILEAFGLNIPVLISDETNVGEYVIKYNVGVLLKKNDPNEIAKEMLNLNKEIINQWKENIPNMVSKEFMWTEISKRIIE